MSICMKNDPTSQHVGLFLDELYNYFVHEDRLNHAMICETWWCLCNLTKQTKCYASVCTKQNLLVWMEYPIQCAKIILPMADIIHHLGCIKHCD